MNRRTILALSTGLAFGGLPAAFVKAQESPLWFVHEDELKTNIVLPNGKQRSKAIKTNRFEGRLPLSDRLIKTAEAVYPTANIGLKTENGRPLWYSDDRYKMPFNVTSRAVNYYFDRAAQDKYVGIQYNVEVIELNSVTKESTNDRGFDEMHNVYEVSLFLKYTASYGNMGGEFFSRQKKVFFNRKEEIVALYMPSNPNEFIAS